MSRYRPPRVPGVYTIGSQRKFRQLRIKFTNPLVKTTHVAKLTRKPAKTLSLTSNSPNLSSNGGHLPSSPRRLQTSVLSTARISLSIGRKPEQKHPRLLLKHCIREHTVLTNATFLANLPPPRDEAARQQNLSGAQLASRNRSQNQLAFAHQLPLEYGIVWSMPRECSTDAGAY